MSRSIILLLLLITATVKAQFKADNVKYKTVFPEELCRTLMANRDYTLLDVRSQGEVDDTSSSEGLNIGHIKNALHIDIRQLPQRWKELLVYKDKPLFIYCSHSQRSRRASRMLADSGFTKVFNINGGLTNFYFQGIQANPCAGFEIETTVPYKILSPKEMTKNALAGKSYYIIDLRSDSVFKGISNIEKTRAEGRFREAINIPFEKFSSYPSFDLSGKSILLVDEYGDVSPKAAKILIQKGYKDVSILFGGMDTWIEYATTTSDRPVVKWTATTNYKLVSPGEFYKWVNSKKQFVLIDVRTKDEFNNASKNYWQNIGQVRDAINIPFSELSNSGVLPHSKDIPLVVYGFNAQPEIFASAKWLKDQGYQNVSILQGGIWGLRWTSHNVSGSAHLNDLVTNVPPENQ